MKKQHWVGIGLLVILIVAGALIIPMFNQSVKTNLVIDDVSILGTGGYGAVFNAQIDPFNDQYFGATCDMGSVYFSFDQGANWIRHNLLGTVYCLKYDVSQNGVIWAGGSGVYKSTDHGRSMRLVFPKPEQITAAGNNYENANYWLYSDRASDYAPQYQIWSIAINRKNSNQVFVAQKIPGTGFGYQRCIRIYQTTNGEDFTLFTELEYANDFKIDYDEVNDCLIYVTQTALMEINLQKNMVFKLERPIALNHTNSNTIAFDSYYDRQNHLNTFVFAGGSSGEHIANAAYYTHDLRDEPSYVDLTAQLCNLKTDDFGVEVPSWNRDLPSYQYCEGVNGKYVRQTFQWNIGAVSVLNDHVIYLYHEDTIDKINQDGIKYGTRRTQAYLKYDATQMVGQKFKWVYGMPLKPHDKFIRNRSWQDSDMGFCFGMTSSPTNENALLFSNIVGLYYTADGQTITQLNSMIQGTADLILQDQQGHSITKTASRVTTTGVDVICSQVVATDPFDRQHLLIGSTDIGLVQSYDGGQSFYHVMYEWVNGNLTSFNYASYANTCFDLHFDQARPGVVYGLWSQAKTAPYTAGESYLTGDAHFGVSYDGGLSWTMKNITADGKGLPYRMQVIYRGTERQIYLAMDSYGFMVTKDEGETFTAMNQGIAPVTIGERQAILGNKILVCDMGIFAITSGSATATTGQGFYQWNQAAGQFESIPIPEPYLPAALRDLVYDANQQCLYLACTAKSVNNDAQLVKTGGGILKYQNGAFTQIYDTTQSVIALNIDGQGTLYATAAEGKLLRLQRDGEIEILLDGLFHILKNINFGDNDRILYVTTWGGGTYKITLKAA